MAPFSCSLPSVGRPVPGLDRRPRRRLDHGRPLALQGRSHGEVAGEAVAAEILPADPPVVPGGAVAAWLAGMHTPAALIIESTFTSLGDVAATMYPYLPVKLLLRFEYNTMECLTKVNCPVMIVHSRDDEIMPFKHGQHLYEAAKEPKVFFEISGTHNEGFITSGEHYEAGLDSFISEFFKTTN